MNALISMLRSIWRFHWLLAGILVIEYALAFAIVAVAASALVARVQAINQSSGIHESGLYVLRGRGVAQPIHRAEALYARQVFSALAGHSHVALINEIPFGGISQKILGISITSNEKNTQALQIDTYEGGEHFPSVLGLRLVDGRFFHADEIVSQYGENAHVAILSQALARHLFHGHSAVGEQVTIGNNTATVVGVVDAMAAPRYIGPDRTEQTLLLPHLPTVFNLLLVRYSGPEARLQTTLKALQRHTEGRVHWTLEPYSEVRANYFQSDNFVVDAFTGVIVIVLVTAICGILGLTSYWISRRRKQIAIRRALGARKHDIFWHFLAESGSLVTLGLAFGVVLFMVLAAYLQVLPYGATALTWLLPGIVVVLLAMFVVYASLRRWLRLDPVELIRTL